MAIRVLTVIKKLSNWAVARDPLESNPAAGVQAPGKETARDRVLSDSELKDVWEGCDALGCPFGLLIRLLILTGQRLGATADPAARD